jgi:hypothetical protein
MNNDLDKIYLDAMKNDRKNLDIACLRVIKNKKYLNTIDSAILLCDSTIANSETASNMYIELIKIKQEKDKKDKLCQDIATLITELVVIPIIIVLLWNWAIVDIFGMGSITYLQAIALTCISDMLFKGVSNRLEARVINNNKLLYQKLAYDIAIATANRTNNINNIEE